MTQPLIEVKDLKKYFPITGGVFQRTVGHVKAVDGVSFSLNKGEALGLVGESGCGKSTTGRTVLRLLEKSGGSVHFKGTDLHSLNKKDLRAMRPKIQLVFQDPYSSLNPRIKVGEAIGEALVDHGIVSRSEVRDRVKEILSICGLAPYHIDRYPHEFSGGQRQRIGIARSLILKPEFMVLDGAGFESLALAILPPFEAQVPICKMKIIICPSQGFCQAQMKAGQVRSGLSEADSRL